MQDAGIQLRQRHSADGGDDMLVHNIPVLGVVENYSYLVCPDCGKKISVFGESHVDDAAAKLGIPVLGKMPIDAGLAQAVEEEKFYEVSNEYLAGVVNKM